MAAFGLGGQLAAEEITADYIATQQDRYLTFLVAGREYGVGLRWLTEIRGLEPLSPPAGAPPRVVGTTELHGMMVPVLDLAEDAGAGRAPRSEQASLVFIESYSGVAGLVVDEVGEVVEIPHDLITPPEDLPEELAAPFSCGARRLGGSVTIILDPESLLPADPADR